MSNISIIKPVGTDGKAILGSNKNSSFNSLEKKALKNLDKDKLNDLGYVGVTDDVIQIAFGKFKVLADKKKHIYDEDIAAIVDDSLVTEDNMMFKSWIKDITEKFTEISGVPASQREVGTDALRDYTQRLSHNPIIINFINKSRKKRAKG